MQNFGVTNKEHYGMLWYFLEWSIAFMPLSLTSLLSLLKLSIDSTQLPGPWTGIRGWDQVCPEKTAEISRRHHCFPREMTSEEQMQKLHTDILLIFMCTTQIWIVSRHQYGIFASDVISPWN